MNAICKCTCGHVFSSRVTEDSPEINYIGIKADEEGCPECGSAEFEVTEYEYGESFPDDCL